MTVPAEDTSPKSLLPDIQGLAKKWKWLLAVGIISIFVGVFALGSSVLMTLASVILFGWILLLVGGIEIGHSFYQKEWGGFLLHLVNGILAIVVGFLLATNPGASAVMLTLLLAMFFMVGGIFRIITALMMRFPSWGWRLLNGVVALVLGILIWNQWPLSGLWVIGFFVGIDLIFSGWASVMLALAARRVQAPDAPKSAAPQNP
ncbi:MAG: HdeD family acid-resistance protein [Syntrophales bacterium]|nr:HdeD family acid-resistance protein [Syntrophales bacterium]MDD5640474.1 HdeD family acid-resistance protein [Syntrophales bacterium]